MRKIFLHLFLAFLFFLLMGPSFTAMGALTSGTDFLLVVPSARPAGMGQAFTAIGDDVDSLLYNPAGLARVQIPELGYDHYQFVSDISFDYISAAVPMGEQGVIGLGFINSGTAPFNSTVDPNTPTVSAEDMAFILGYGIPLDWFQLGASVKYIQRQVGDVQGTGFLGDVGFRIRAHPRLAFAASVQNLGMFQILNENTDIPTLVRAGLEWKPLSLPQHSLELALDGDYQFNSQAKRWGGGMEYWYQDLFALRAGYVGNSDEESLTVGAGVRFSYFQLDYAYEPFTVLGSTHRLSLLCKIEEGSREEIPAPTAFQGANSNDGLYLKWKPPTSAEVTGYYLFVKKPETEVFTKLTAHPVTDTSVTLKHLKTGQEYTFGVEAIGPNGGQSLMTQLAIIPEEPTLSPPTGFQAQSVPEGLKLIWDKVESKNVAGFNLYRADEQGEQEKKLNQEPITENQVVLKKLKPGQTYRFLLTAVAGDGTESSPTEVLRVDYNGPGK